MIHFFDGFKTPVANGLTMTDANTMAQFTSAGNIRCDTDYMYATTGSYTSNRTYFRYTTGRSRVKTAVADKLVIGVETLYRNKVFFGLPVRSDETLPYASWNYEGSWRTSGIRLQSELPYLFVTDDHTTITTPAGTTNRSGALPSEVLFSVDNTGVNITTPHFYEIVYDFVADLIEVYIDDVLQASVPYTFTEAQKAANWYIYPEFSGPQPSNSRDSNTFYTRVGLIYAATERLGPVKTVLKVPASDYAVDASFGVGPHYSKLSLSSDSANGIATSATTSASATFTTSAPIIDTETLAVNVLGRASSEHVSALKTLATAKLSIETPTGQWEGTTFDVPENDSNFRIEYLELNPMTGAPWTVDDLDQIRIGMKLSSRPRSDQ